MASTIAWCKYAGIHEKDPVGGGAYQRCPSGDAGTHTRTDAPYHIRAYIRPLALYRRCARVAYSSLVDSYDRCTRGNMRIKDAFCRVRILLASFSRRRRVRRSRSRRAHRRMAMAIWHGMSRHGTARLTVAPCIWFVPLGSRYGVVPRHADRMPVHH